MEKFGFRKATKTIAGVIALTFAMAQAPARAQDEDSWDFGAGFEAILLGMALVEGYLLIGGTVVGGSNLFKAAQGKRASSGQLVHGYILSGLNILVGSLLLSDSGDTGKTLGAVQLGIGIADLGLTIWSHVQDDGNKQALSISPMILPDRNGATAVGFGIQLTGW